MRLEISQVRLPLSQFCLELDVVLNKSRTVIFGPSGAGKTSLLETIAGLRNPVRGRIVLDDCLFDEIESAYALAIRKREVGYVPQDDSLFPHLSVRHNLLYGHNRQNGRNAAVSFDHVIAFLEIKSLLERNVSSLSRGENQRIVLARALLSGPRLLLLDEPLTGLDARLKGAILEQLQSLHHEFHIPMLYVTHDSAEAIAICDEVLMMETGQMTGRGDPRKLLAPPGPSAL
jgi:molybdate transport system ATP-binding protein